MTIEMSAVIGAMIVHVAAAKGVDPAALVAATGFDPAIATDPDARITLDLEEKLWNEAARLADDDAFGLHAAELVRPGAFDVLDYAIRSAPTLRVSLERLARYNRLVHDVAVFTLSDRGDRTRIEHTFRVGGAVQSRHSAEFTIASLVTVGGQLIESTLATHAVGFRHAAPRSPHALAEHRRIFGVEPAFAQGVNSLELDRAVLERPVVKADPALSRLIERHAEALLAALPSIAQTTADRVRRLVSSSLREGDATLAGAAKKLKMSERSLQRRLSDEGVTFDAIVDDLRKDLALRYLADDKIAIAEVAYLLGYSEPSPFHRAFKRWTGKTPTEVRRSAA